MQVENTARIGPTDPLSHPGAQCSLSAQLQMPFRFDILLLGQLYTFQITRVKDVTFGTVWEEGGGAGGGGVV